MVKSSGLGKGLGALFAEGSNNNYDSIMDETDEVAKEIKIIEIEPNRNQPRKNFNQELLEELADSIKQYGVIQPIVVSKKEDYYEIIAGERRWRAAKIAGLATIPAVVRKDEERKNKEIALIENIQREDLNPIEKGIGIKKLMEEYNLTQQQVAEMLGKSRSGVANSMRLLNLDERVKDLILEGKLTEGHAKVLLSEEDKDKQYEMAVLIIEGAESVRDLERKISNKKILEPTAQKYNTIFADVENKFKDFFGTKVKLNAGKKAGKIIIEYSNNDELERILGLIK